MGDDVGSLDGAKVGELVGGSGSMHRSALHMLSSEQHVSSTSHMPPGTTHILPVGAIVGAWVGIAVGSGVFGAIIFMVGLAVIAAAVVTIGSGTKSKSMQSLFACGLNSNPII